MKNFIAYGYKEEDIDKIKEEMGKIFDSNFYIISAEKKLTISEILKKKNKNFTEEKHKVIMFSDFSGKDVDKVLQNFPKSIQRPIFCMRTEHNIKWKFEDLLEELLEEQLYFKNQKK